MNLTEAVQAAKNCIRATLADEQPINIGLEEFEFDEKRNVWLITIGFSRTNPIDQAIGVNPLFRDYSLPRLYRIIEVDDKSGSVKAMRLREMAS